MLMIGDLRHWGVLCDLSGCSHETWRILFAGPTIPPSNQNNWASSEDLVLPAANVLMDKLDVTVDHDPWHILIWLVVRRSFWILRSVRSVLLGHVKCNTKMLLRPVLVLTRHLLPMMTWYAPCNSRPSQDGYFVDRQSTWRMVSTKDWLSPLLDWLERAIPQAWSEQWSSE